MRLASAMRLCCAKARRLRRSWCCSSRMPGSRVASSVWPCCVVVGLCVASAQRHGYVVNWRGDGRRVVFHCMHDLSPPTHTIDSCFGSHDLISFPLHTHTQSNHTCRVVCPRANVPGGRSPGGRRGRTPPAPPARSASSSRVGSGSSPVACPSQRLAHRADEQCACTCCDINNTHTSPLISAPTHQVVSPQLKAPPHRNQLPRPSANHRRVRPPLQQEVLSGLYRVIGGSH